MSKFVSVSDIQVHNFLLLTLRFSTNAERLLLWERFFFVILNLQLTVMKYVPQRSILVDRLTFGNANFRISFSFHSALNWIGKYLVFAEDLLSTSTFSSYIWQ